MYLKKISTIPRYFYLNFYAILLLFAGVCIAFIPLYRTSPWLIILQAVPAWLCIRNSVRIFSSWKDKKRKYAILMERNADGFRPDTFKVYMEAPCGRLLVRLVLKDLGYSDKYRSLLIYRNSLAKNLQDSCKPTKTVIYISKKAE